MIILGLTFPSNAQAQVVYEKEPIKTEFQQPYLALHTENTLYRPSEEAVERALADYQAEQRKIAAERQRVARNKAASLAKSLDKDCIVFLTQCVCYAKTLTGHYGTWGDGGRKLSLNSGPVTGAVIIFKHIHVAVITVGIDHPLFDGTNIIYTDRNSDNNGGIRLSVSMPFNDPSVRGFHKF